MQPSISLEKIGYFLRIIIEQKKSVHISKKRPHRTFSFSADNADTECASTVQNLHFIFPPRNAYVRYTQQTEIRNN